MELQLISKIEEAVGKFGDDLETDIVHLPNGILFFNKEVPEEHFLNFAVETAKPESVQEFVESVERIFEDFKAHPSFSIDPNTSDELKHYLLKHGYSKSSNTAWMFFEPHKETPKLITEGFEVKKVENEEQFKIFAGVMVEVFSKGELDDPYKGFSTKWNDVLLRQYHNHSSNYQLETFLACINGEAVGGAELFYDGQVGYLDWLSVLPKYRKLGIGKALQVIRVNRAKELGAKYICLLTEVGSRNEKIFSNFGFKTEFTTQDLIKK